MPLNEVLYDRLQRRLGGVIHICKPGEKAMVDHYTDVVTRKLCSRRLSGGEEYVCRCPFCDDQRGHLYVNHTYGTFDELTGLENTHLAMCFRRGCLEDEHNRRLLFEMVFSDLAQDRRRTIKVSEGTMPLRDPSKLEEIKPPGKILPLASLEAYHPAVTYLTGRGYDIRELSDIWRLGFAIEPCHYLALGRVYIPAFMHGKLVGWQARYPGDLPKHSSVKKYHCARGMPKNLILYNYDLAKLSKVVVICEGPSDVWRVGKCGVAVMGSTLSRQNEELIVSTWAEGAVVILGDADEPNAQDAAAAIYNRLLGKVRAVFNVKLPDGTDPGNHSREDLWNMIVSQANTAGADEEVAGWLKGAYLRSAIESV